MITFEISSKRRSIRLEISVLMKVCCFLENGFFFIQYIPSKRHRFGIKFFLLCDCEAGYILDFIVYTGASTNIKEFEEADIGKTGNIVMTLLEPS